MSRLEKLIKLNSLEKQNRRNRLEDKLRHQEYYGDIEKLFDPLTKTSKPIVKHGGPVVGH